MIADFFQLNMATSRVGLRLLNLPSLALRTRPQIPSMAQRMAPAAIAHLQTGLRWNSATSAPKPLTDRAGVPEDQRRADQRLQQPTYNLTFTCRRCLHRSSHFVSHQSYHHGTTLITCQGCKGRHLISDHLKIFSDKSITVEDLMREKGELLKKGRLGEDGDIEFYDETPKKDI